MNHEQQDLSPQQLKQVSSEMEVIGNDIHERDEDANDLIEYVKTNWGIWLQQDNILKTERLGRPLSQMRLLRVQFDSKLKQRSVLKMRPINSNENSPKVIRKARSNKGTTSGGQNTTR